MTIAKAPDETSPLRVDSVLAAGPVAPLGLKAEEQELVALVDGQRTILEILGLTGLSGSVAMRLLRSLAERGIVVAVASGSYEEEDPDRPRTVDLAEAVEELRRRNAQREAEAREAAAAPAEVAVPRETGSAFERQGVEVPTFPLGRYDVLMRLGAGAMASVYLCRAAGDFGFSRLFTVKVVRKNSAELEEAVRALLREAELASAIADHPNIVGVQDVGTYDGQPFVILDYVEGLTLAEIISSPSPPPPSVIVAIFLDVLTALDWVHTRSGNDGAPLGLVHADLSPENIVVGVDGIARLTGFGSARSNDLRGDDAAPAGVANAAHMSPEQLMGETVDARSDLFVLGATLWSALTAQRLFAGDDVEETAINVVHKKIDPPSAYGVPGVLNDLCLKALQRKREDRYGGAAEMRAALVRVAVMGGLLASPSEVGAWVRSTGREALEERRRRLARFPAPVKRENVTPPPVTERRSAPVPVVRIEPEPITDPITVPPLAPSDAGADEGRRWIVLTVVGILVGALVGGAGLVAMRMLQ